MAVTGTVGVAPVTARHLGEPRRRTDIRHSAVPCRGPAA